MAGYHTMLLFKLADVNLIVCSMTLLRIKEMEILLKHEKEETLDTSRWFIILEDYLDFCRLPTDSEDVRCRCYQVTDVSHCSNFPGLN